MFFRRVLGAAWRAVIKILGHLFILQYVERGPIALFKFRCGLAEIHAGADRIVRPDIIGRGVLNIPLNVPPV